jgi:hypothetical protein
MKRWAGHATCMEGTRNTRKLLIGRDNLGEKVVDEMIILRYIWWEYNICGLDLSVIGSGLMLRIFERGNVSSNSTERGEYFNWLDDYWFFKNFASCSWFLINNNSEEWLLTCSPVRARPHTALSVLSEFLSRISQAILLPWPCLATALNFHVNNSSHKLTNFSIVWHLDGSNCIYIDLRVTSLMTTLTVTEAATPSEVLEWSCILSRL